MLINNPNVPFFLDNTLNKNFKVFGQILYVYFDPTFRRYVSVVDVGLKQKATIFVDEIFRYRKSFLSNNFQFLFLKKKDTFFLKPVHFLNSKNERVLKRRYLSFRDKKFSFLKLNSFSTLALKYFNAKVENEFNFKNENFLSYISLKSSSIIRLVKSYKFYALMFLNLLKDLKTSKHKIYKILQVFFFLNFLALSVLNAYKSLLYVLYIQNKISLSHFFSWFSSFKQNIINIFIYNVSDLKLKKLFISESNNFFNFRSEKYFLDFFKLLNRSKIKKSRKLKKIKKLKKIFSYNSKTNNRVYTRGLNENSNLLNLSALSAERFNKLEFSFNTSDKFSSIRFNFLNSNFDNKITALTRKLRTKNYFSIFSRGRAFALVNRLSFLNTFSYSAFIRRRIFRNWLKFLMYFEKLNYLIILKNEEVSFDARSSSLFFYSLYFPIVFNFRNLFFNLLKFFKFLKSVNEKFVFKNLGSWVYKDKVFNKRFFGILLNFLLLNNKKFNKIPKNLLLNTLSLYYKSNFKSLNVSKFNNLSVIKNLFLNILNIFLDKINYLVVNLNPNEKFINASLFKLAFINFSLGFNNSSYLQEQLSLNSSIQNSKDYLNTEWTPIFKIFKSLKIISKYSKRYRRRPNFSKRKKFKPAFRKRGQFLASLGKSFKLQKLFIYPFKSRALNTQKWSAVVNKIRVSPAISRYGAYLNRLNSLSNKFKSKVRLFPLTAFKNRLSLNFDKSKQYSSSNIYYQRIFSNILPKSSKTFRSLKILKRDRFIRRWDKNQFYANPVNKNFKHKFNKNNFKNINFSKRRFDNSKYQFKKGSFNTTKKPFYRPRFKKHFV